MLIYLSKKIAIPNSIKLHCLSWNTEQGWIACGGDDTLMKVFKLEATGEDNKMLGIANPTNLTMTQTLEGHNGAVVCITWNPIYRKLTTSDECGLIIVWVLHKGMWHYEMTNNRNKSVVSDMKWTTDGKKICIVYEDGAVIVGSVEGNRIWGKELRLPLRYVEWAPDCQTILFITNDAEAILYSADGNKIRTFDMVAQDRGAMGEIDVGGIAWHAAASHSVLVRSGGACGCKGKLL